MAKFKKTELTVLQAKHNSEKRRIEVGSVRVDFEIRLWEKVRLFHDWTPMSEFYREDWCGPEAQRIRRFMRHLEAHGWIDIRKSPEWYYPGGPSYLEFRSRVTC